MSHSKPAQGHDLRPNDPILPNQSLGGIALRQPIEALEHLLNQIPTRYIDTSWCEIYPPWEVRYLLGPIAVATDVRNGRIFKLLALPGYKGALFGTIRVGMIIQEVQALEPRLYFEGASETFLIAGCPGVALDISEIDPDPHKLPEMPISAISVYAVETPNLR